MVLFIDALCRPAYVTQISSVQPFEAEARVSNISEFIHTSNRTQHFTVTKINWLMLFKEIIAVCSENHTTSGIKNKFYRFLRR
jgi:hypothetical protein